MKFRYTLSLLISCLSSLAFLSSPAVAEPKKDGPRRSIVFFGDSLSDTGNRYFDERIKNTPPYDLAAAENLVPSYPYAIGGPTYTNGRAWPTHFARALGDPGSAQPALRNTPRALNYAYAGARASNDPPLADGH